MGLNSSKEEPNMKRKAGDVVEEQEPKAPKVEHRCEGILIKALPHLEDKLWAIVEAPKFRKWLATQKPEEITLTEFTVTDVDFFGPVQPNRLGFVKGFGTATDAKTGEAIPAIVFIRGGAIAVLIVVKVRETQEKHLLLCKQLRFPMGRYLLEVCAGMLDEKTGNAVGVAFKEVQEETGFVVAEKDLISLGEIIPSGGGCDEVISLFAWETEVSQEEFEEKKVKVFGEGTHEKIQLQFHPFGQFDNVLDEIGDVKAECCWRRYKNYLSRKTDEISGAVSTEDVVVETAVAGGAEPSNSTATALYEQMLGESGISHTTHDVTA